MEEQEGEGQDLLRVTIIMPVRNEAGYIERSVRAVLGQDYPRDLIQVLVVDGMSVDGTRDIVRSLGAELLDNPARIVPTALNLGLRHAVGDIVIRVDGHCEISSTYVRQCVEALARTGADCVGGHIVTVGTSLVSRTIALAQSSFFGVGGPAFRTGRSKPSYVDTLAFGAYRREVFQRIGGFDERLVRHQDYEFNLRLRQSGGRIYYDPDIHALYYSRSTFTQLASQYFQYAYWKALVTRVNPAAFRWRHAAPVSLVLLLLILTLVSPLHIGAYKFCRLAWLLYLSAVFITSLSISYRHGWKHMAGLAFAFLIIHIAWGLGFWFGLGSTLAGTNLTRSMTSFTGTFAGSKH